MSESKTTTMRSRRCNAGAIHSIRLVNPINHSNHSTPSTINMFLVYLYVHDRTE